LNGRISVVGDQKAGPCKGVRDVEGPDEGGDGAAGTFFAVSLLVCGADRPCDEGDAHTGCGDDEEEATADLVDHHGAGAADDESEYCGTTVESELGITVVTPMLL